MSSHLCQARQARLGWRSAASAEWAACGLQNKTIIVGGDNRYLNYTTLVDGLSTIREFDFEEGAITFAQNISTPRW